MAKKLSLNELALPGMIFENGEIDLKISRIILMKISDWKVSGTNVSQPCIKDQESRFITTRRN